MLFDIRTRKVAELHGHPSRSREPIEKGDTLSQTEHAPCLLLQSLAFKWLVENLSLRCEQQQVLGVLLVYF